MTAADLVLLPAPRVIRLDGAMTASSKFRTDETGPMYAFAVAALHRRDPSPSPDALTVRFGELIGSDKPQHYLLIIERTSVRIAASDASGAFFAVQTLLQIVKQCDGQLPCVHIDDYPDIAVRGVMLDISRDKVPTMATLFELVDQLASMKFNQLQLYTEHTFAYRGHEEVWQNASPMTPAEVRELDQYCADRCIELVPNQNSFGHMERWLNHEKYKHLAEAPDGSDTPWNFRWKGPFSLCPTDPESLDLLADLFGQLLPCFSSKLLNVGCDETFDVGQGRSKAECDARGETTVYVEFLTKVNQLVESHGSRMMFWGDIIVKHPDRIASLPKQAVALEWGYEADHPFDEHARAFAAAGLEFYLCPGTSSWNSFAGRTDNAIENLKNAAWCAIDHGAAGYLITDWGDYGHTQYLPASYTAFAAGAAFSWCLSANREVAKSVAIAVHGFAGSSATLAKAWYDLGNVYRVECNPTPNASRIFRVLVLPPNDDHPEKHLSSADLEAILVAVDAAMAPAQNETGLAADELRNAATMMQHAVAVARRKLNLPGEPVDVVSSRWQHLVAEHRRLWIARNRPGGMEDSVGRLLP